VTISIVDVDVVLTFANGSRLILPSFVLSMITTDPPTLAFNGAAVDPQSLIAAAGDVALVDQLPQLTLSDSAKTQGQGEADKQNGEAPAAQVVQMTASQSYAHTAPPTARGEGASRGAIDALNTGSIGRSDSSRAGDQQTAGLKGEGALTERSDKIDGQVGNAIVNPGDVDPPNAAPSITSNGGGVSGNVTLAENQISVTGVTGSDPNAGDRLVFSIIGGEDVSRFAINGADGRLYFVEAPDFEAHNAIGGSNTYEVIVQVSDGKLSDSQTLLVTVNNVNEAPIDASISNATLGENAATGFFLGRVAGTDPDAGAVLTYSFAPGGDAGGRFAIDAITGDVTVIRGDLIDFEASNSQLLIVRVSDQDGLSLDRPIVISVTDANDAPVITSNGGGSSAAITLGEGARTITTVTATDEDAGSVISYSIVGGADAAAFQIDSVTGLVSFRVSPDFELPGDANLDNVYLLVIEASDGQGGTDQQELAVNVIVNKAPEITSYGGLTTVDITHPENALTVGTITAVDPENAPLTYSISGGADAALFAVNASTGVLTFIGNPDFEGAADSDGDNIYTVTVQAFDGSFADSQTLNITLVDMPEAPTILSNGGGPAATINILENTLAVTDVNATDPDAGTTLTYAIVGGADGALFSIDAATGNLTLLAPANFENPGDADGNNRYEVIVEVSDGVLIDQQALSVVIQNANDAPVITSNGGGDTALILHTENNTAVTTVQASDDDVGATLIYTIFGGLDAALFTLDSATGALRFIANPSFETPADSNGDNTYQVIVRVLDGAGGVDVQTISVEVRDGNDAPVIISDGGGDTATRSVQENSTFVTTVQATDPDLGATRSFSLVGGADAGFFTINAVSGDLSFISGRDFENPADQSANNSYEVIVQVSDGAGGFDTQTITVNITGVNEAPDITSDGGGPSASLDISENTTVVTTVTAVDPDAGATRSYAIVGGADSGRFTIDAGGALRFTSAQSFEAPGDADGDNIYDVVVQVSDNAGGFDTQALAVRILDVNEAPTAVVLANPMTTLQENSVIPGGGVKVGDIVVTDDALGTEVLSLGGPDAAFFQIVGTELFYIGPSPDFEAKASYQVNVLVDDATVGATPDLSLAVTVSVGDLNEGPSAITLAGPRLVAENAAAAVVGAISVTDPDAGSTFTYTVSDARFEVVGGNLRLRAGQSLNRETEASITLDVTATDQGMLSTTSTFTISVTDVDEFDVTAPVDGNVAADAVTENAAIGTVVGITVSASDADATTNTVGYTLASNPGGLFAINAVTGVVTVASAIDREVVGPTTNITVRATSADGSVADTVFTIAVGDQNESPVGPVSDGNVAANTVLENAAIGTAVGITASAVDPDQTNNTVSYSLSSNPGGLFAIDAVTGVVTVASAINREVVGPTTSITVLATSADGSTSSQSFSIAIGDVDEFDVTAPVDGNVAADAVTENAAIGTVVGITVSASDADATTNTVGYTLASNPGGLFAINAVTGVVTVASAIDREVVGPTTNITVRATSADGSVADTVFTIAVGDQNESPVGPVSDGNVAANTVLENAAIGTAVGITASAVDPDQTNNTVSYSLSSNPGGLFAIDAVTGVVTVASAINREVVGPTTSITVLATSADGSTSSQSFSIAIGDVDEFDVTAPVDGNVAADAVTENAAIGTVVGITVSASDADATTNTVGYTLASNPGGLFAINAVTGVVTVASAIDREVVGPTTNITVRATSADGSVADTVFTIAVGDQNESPVGPVSDGNVAANTVLENAAIGTAVGITASAVDPDQTNNTVSYSLSSNPGGLFAIDAVTGVVTVASAINREVVGPTTSITVLATSADGSTSSQSFSIAIGDVDEFDVTAPVDGNVAADAVTENAAIGTVVGITVSASDADATTNTVGYTLASNPGGLFAINAVTGVVTVASAIDREVVGPTTNITVRATSADGSVADTVFTIAVGDQNESPVGPVSDGNVAANTVLENAAIGTAVGITASAVDPDQTNNTVSYSLSSNPGGLFAIDAVTGVVTVASAINREVVGPTTSITVLATSADGSTSSQSFSIAIGDVDEFDVTAPVDGNVAADAVTENAAIGTVVGITVSASDADATNNAVSYSLLSNPGGLFAIEDATGIVTVDSAINREAVGASVSITVRATSIDGSVADTVFTIAVADANEFDVTGPVDADLMFNWVTENAAVGTAVGITALASDADATTNAVSYSLASNPGGLFAIDALTGVVTVASAIDREVVGPSTNITVRATSADGSVADTIFTIAVADTNEFDVSAPVDGNGTANTVMENVAIGTPWGSRPARTILTRPTTR
jgi:hypothetical protein